MSVSVTSPEQLEEYLALPDPDQLPFDLVDEKEEEEATYSSSRGGAHCAPEGYVSL